MQMKIKKLKIRKTLLVVAVAVIVAGCNQDSKKADVFASAAKEQEMPMVYPCGFPVGIYMNTKGVMVIAATQIIAKNGSLPSPCEGSLKKGDYITKIDGTEVETKENLISMVENCNGQPVTLHIVSDGQEFDLSVLPVKDHSEKYRLGIWIKDDVQGIGTMTYICEDGRFGALGHPINDNDTGVKVEVGKGGLYESQIRMIIRGSSGLPGSFCGIICYDKESFLGNVYENNSRGIYGNISALMKKRLKGALMMQTAKRSEVSCGKALLRCCIEEELHDYEVEIIKADPYGTEGLQIKVTDPELLEKTGGVIRGMSGSPLLKDGKIIGAVTHVFVNDPTKGYGIFIEDMLDAEE